MSREIKFRAWDGEEYWYDVVPSPIPSPTLDVCKNPEGIVPEYDNEVHIIRGVEAVEQYTGLKDEDGKEIYEGDIVQIYKHCSPEKDGKPRVVRWNEKDCSYAGIYPNISAWSQHEVIGNIHENPELLGGEE